MGILFWLPLVLAPAAFGSVYGLKRLGSPIKDVPIWVESLLWPFPSLLLLIILWFSVRAGLCWDAEYWNGWATAMKYTEEEWRTETYTTTDSKGNTTTRTRVVYDPPSWRLHDSMGGSHPIDKQRYDSIAHSWGYPHPPSGGSSGRSYWVKWNGDHSTGLPITVKHSYKNKTLRSHSVFSFRDHLSKEETEGLHEWPKLEGLYAPALIGYAGQDAPQVERHLQVINADLGSSKQIRVHVLVWYNRGASVSELQREYWKGGNKNELNICLGLDSDNNVEWCRVFSWSESEDLKSEIAAWPEAGKPIDWAGFLGFVRTGIETKWQRKRFKDFDYLTVDMPAWSVGLAWFLCLVSTGLLVYFRWKR